MKKIWLFWREASISILAAILGSIMGTIIHNNFFKEFTIVGIDSVHIVSFLFALAVVVATEIYRNRK